MGFGFGLRLGLGKRVRGKWGWGWGLKIYPWTRMEMKIIPANGGGPGMDGVFLSGYGDRDYTPHPRSGPLPSLTRRDRWPALCPCVPMLTPPLHSVAIAPSLASRSCVAKPDHGYPKCTLVPPRRSHQCQPQSIPNPSHELDMEYIFGAWRREIPHGQLTCWVVKPTGTQQCLTS